MVGFKQTEGRYYHQLSISKTFSISTYVQISSMKIFLISVGNSLTLVMWGCVLDDVLENLYWRLFLWGRDTLNKEHGSIEIMGKRKYNYTCVRNIDINWVAL